MFWNKWSEFSVMRRRYAIKLVGRCVIFIACVVLMIVSPQEAEILRGAAFFERFSVLHLLWLLWIADMVEQLVPVRKKIPIGSQKLFKLRFRPARRRIDREVIWRYVTTTTTAAYKVMLLWILLLTVIGFLYYQGILSDSALFLISVAFYVCDLICVLIWCPFRLLMKTRCCTTCRIFNWDHLMMFTPMIFIRGFYPQSLAVLAIAAWLVWEVFVLLYPERFWEGSNEALQCASCTDKLCSQYCRKLRD